MLRLLSDFNMLTISSPITRPGLCRQTPFFWQDEYGAFTLDRKRLPDFVGYVERQKEHHAQNRLIPILERTVEQPLKTIAESPSLYWIEDPEWRRELEQLEAEAV
jgi:hypothetical protein